MTNETTLVLKTSEPVDWIVLDGEGIEKGTIMILSGSSTIGRTILSGSGVNKPFGCIARREKIANDGRTRLSGFRESIFRMTADTLETTIKAGDGVMLSGSNTIIPIKASPISRSALLLGLKIGTALEDFASGETKEVWVGR